MSRKNRAPRRTIYPDPNYKSITLSKFVNFMMFDGKKTTAEKIIYTAFEQIKNKTKEDPIKVFNDAVNNIRPNLEVRSRRVGGATYQVPVEVKTSRSQTLALRWLLDASRKRKTKICQIDYLMNLWMLIKKKVMQLKKEKKLIEWQSQIKLLLILDGNND